MGDAAPAVLHAAFHAHAAALYHYIYAKVRDGPLAEDLTGEVFLKALRWVQPERSAASVRGWLYATARTTVAEYWRSQGQQLRVPLEAVEERWAQEETAGHGQADARDRLLPLLWRLSTRERAVLTLRYLHGYSTVEIGQMLGASPASVRQIHRRAIRHVARDDTAGRSSPMSMSLEKLTDEARQVLVRAEEEALSMGHDFVGTEVVLLALLHGDTLAAQVLRRLGVEDYRIRGGIALILGRGLTRPTEATLVPRVKEVLAYAVAEAEQLGQSHVGPEHILLGLVREGHGIAAGLLEAVNVPLEHVREETLKAVGAA